MTLNDVTRLEVDASDVTNEIANHSAVSSTAGWTVAASFGSAALTRATGLSGHGYAGTALRATYTGSPNGERMTGPSYPVSAGEWTTFQAELYRVLGLDITIDAYVQFLNGSNTVIATSSVFAGYFTTSGGFPRTIVGTPVQAPTGTANARVYLEFIAGGTTLTIDLSKVMAVCNADQALVADVPFTDTTAWQNILGAATYVKIHRGLELDGVVDVLDVGTLTAEVLDPLIDPFANSRIEKGRAVRLTVLDSTLANSRTVFTGTIDSVNVDYSGSKTPDAPSTRVTLLATDCVQTLKNITQPTGKSGRFRQRIDAAMTGISSVTYSVTDTDSDTTSATLTVDPNASAYTQLVLARDTLQGFLWVDATNTLQCRAANSAPDATALTLVSDDLDDAGDDTVFYTGIAIRGGSDTVVNSLLVTKAGVGVPGGSREFGPYINAASVGTYGSQGAEITINSGSPSSLAADYLALYAAPRKFVQSVTFDATDDPYAHAAALSPYVAVEVKRTGIVDDDYRILGIDHDITPDRWTTTLGLRPVEVPDTITVTNPAAGADTGPADLVTAVIDPHNVRYRTSDMTISTSTETTVDFNVAGDNAGITWDATNKRWNVPGPGRYLVVAALTYVANATGRRVGWVNHQGAHVPGGYASLHVAVGQLASVLVAAVVYCAAGDNLSITTWQNSGGNLALNGGTEYVAGTVTYLGA
jgi:hypothetical protein